MSIAREYASYYLAFALILAGLSGCASTVKPGFKPVDLNGRKIGKVGVAIKEETAAHGKVNSLFKTDLLTAAVEKALKESDLLLDGAPLDLQVEVTDLKMRSTFSAVMFGFMAGADVLTGNVYLKNESGETTGDFHVSASYALGGIGGGQDQLRLSELYNQFGKAVVKALNKAGQKVAMK